MSVSDFESVQDVVQAKKAFDNTNAVAGTAPDAAAITGDTVDRSTVKYARSAVILIPYTCAIASGKKLTLGSMKIEHGDASNLSDKADYKTISDITITNAAEGATPEGVKSISVHLGGAKRYVRLLLTPDADAASVDTWAIGGVWCFGSAYKTP